LYRVPLLGWLFKQDVIDEKSSELLIFITPRITRE
jgi:type II secretory pathway component HofQ